MNLHDTVALVTGANRGLGARLVDELLAAGARKVYATSRGGTIDRETAADPRVVVLPLDVTDAVYKAAGTSAFVLGTPFERRFRDIHTLSQQIQSREAHFEMVGKVMLNGDPENTFLG